MDNHIGLTLFSPSAAVWGMKAGEEERRSVWEGGLCNLGNVQLEYQAVYERGSVSNRNTFI